MDYQPQRIGIILFLHQLRNFVQPLHKFHCRFVQIGLIVRWRQPFDVLAVCGNLHVQFCYPLVHQIYHRRIEATVRQHILDNVLALLFPFGQLLPEPFQFRIALFAFCPFFAAQLVHHCVQHHLVDLKFPDVFDRHLVEFGRVHANMAMHLIAADIIGVLPALGTRRRQFVATRAEQPPCQEIRIPARFRPFMLFAIRKFGLGFQPCVGIDQRLVFAFEFLSAVSDHADIDRIAQYGEYLVFGYLAIIFPRDRHSRAVLTGVHIEDVADDLRIDWIGVQHVILFFTAPVSERHTTGRPFAAGGDRHHAVVCRLGQLLAHILVHMGDHADHHLARQRRKVEVRLGRRDVGLLGVVQRVHDGVHIPGRPRQARQVVGDKGVPFRSTRELLEDLLHRRSVEIAAGCEFVRQLTHHHPAAGGDEAAAVFDLRRDAGLAFVVRAARADPRIDQVSRLRFHVLTTLFYFAKSQVLCVINSAVGLSGGSISGPRDKPMCREILSTA